VAANVLIKKIFPQSQGIDMFNKIMDFCELTHFSQQEIQFISEYYDINNGTHCNIFRLPSRRKRNVSWFYLKTKEKFNITKSE